MIEYTRRHTDRLGCSSVKSAPRPLYTHDRTRPTDKSIQSASLQSKLKGEIALDAAGVHPSVALGMAEAAREVVCRELEEGLLDEKEDVRGGGQGVAVGIPDAPAEEREFLGHDRIRHRDEGYGGMLKEVRAREKDDIVIHSRRHRHDGLVFQIDVATLREIKSHREFRREHIHRIVHVHCCCFLEDMGIKMKASSINIILESVQKALLSAPV